MDLWNKYHLDTILILGDMLYQKSLKQNRCLKDLKLENILKTFFPKQFIKSYSHFQHTRKNDQKNILSI